MDNSTEKSDTLRVMVGDWAFENMRLLKDFGFELDKSKDERGYWPVREMTREQLFALASKFMVEGLGVMIRPPSQKRKKDDDVSWDYLLYVDTARGRFMTR
jgi:hypothetical protein